VQAARQTEVTFQICASQLKKIENTGWLRVHKGLL
jgi:hypothetical protein